MARIGRQWAEILPASRVLPWERMAKLEKGRAREEANGPGQVGCGPVACGTRRSAAWNWGVHFRVVTGHYLRGLACTREREAVRGIQPVSISNSISISFLGFIYG
jgi:hypothetical protein